MVQSIKSNLFRIKLVSGFLVPVLTMLFVVGLLFYPYFKDNRAPIALDIPVGMYYPWYNDTFGYAVRPPVKNSLISDTVSQFWIWRNRAVPQLGLGKVDIWNPYSFSGYEMSPWFHTILFSPLNIFYFVLPVVDAMSFIVISQVIVSLVGGFLLGKSLYSSSLVGGFLAIGWTMSSYFVGWLTWGTISFALAMIPWSLYFIEKYLKSKNQKIFLFLTVLSIAALILSGHPQTIGYGMIIFFIWSSTRSLTAGKRLLPSLLMSTSVIIVGLLLCSPAIFPSIEIVKNSIRSHESLANVNYGFIPWSKILVGLFSVNFFGNPSSGNYFGGDYNFQEKFVNFGTIPLFFAIYQTIKLVRTRKFSSLDILGLSFFLIGILMATSAPLGYLIYRFNMPLLSTSPAGRATIIMIFGGMIMSCSGLIDIIQKKLNTRALVHTIIYFLSFHLAAYGIVLGYLRLISTFPVDVAFFYQSIKSNFTTAARNTIYPMGIFFILSSLILFIKKTGKFTLPISFFIVILMFLEGFIFFRKITPFVPKNLYFPSTPSLNYIQERYKSTQDFFRVERESGELLPPNMWEVFGFYSTSGYDPIAPLPYEKYMIKKEVKGNYSRYFENGDAVDKLENLGVRYFLVLRRNKEAIPVSGSSLSYKINQKVWKPVFSEGPVEILENSNYKPPYFLDKQQKSDFISLVGKKSDYWEFEIQSSTSQNFVLMENNSKSWLAYVDGNKVAISSYEGTFKQVAIPSGKHKLQFSYQNKDLRTGLIISVVIWVSCVVYLLLFS